MVRDDTLVIVLAGGAGERLAPLTRDRAKPAVPFGGPYRIIDFALSNCVNSGLRRMFIATQYKSLSLNRHIRMGWSIVSEELGEFIEVLPPQKRVGEHWYQGTADAVYQNLYSIEREAPRHVVVLAGDHIYKMDYRKMLHAHADHGADVTMATIEVPVEDATRFGVVAVDADRRVDRLPGEAGAAGADARPARTWPWPRWASTSSTWTCWCKALDADAADPDSHHDFGKDIIPRLHRPGPRLRLPLPRREQEDGEVLARRRHARRLLRGQHGPLPRQPGLQPLRSGVAAAHLSSRRRRRRSSSSPTTGGWARRSTR